MFSITRSIPASSKYDSAKRETVIGTFTVTESYEMKTSEQTACNYYMIRVDPGTYEVIVSSAHDSVIVRIEGEVVDEHFVNRLFTASSLAEPRDIGKRSTRCSRQLYRYDAAKEFATNPAWELAEDWKVEMTTFVLSDGRPHKSFKLVQAS